jgi:hypothetical protein
VEKFVEQLEAGRIEGRRWASESAKPSEPRGLDKITEDELNLLLSECAQEAFGSDEKLAFAIFLEDEQDRSDARDFWLRAMDSDPHELDAELEGFVGGALEEDR